VSAARSRPIVCEAHAKIFELPADRAVDAQISSLPALPAVQVPRENTRLRIGGTSDVKAFFLTDTDIKINYVTDSTTLGKFVTDHLLIKHNVELGCDP